MKTLDSIEELNQENIHLYVDEVWEAISENLYDKFTAMSIIVDDFEDEINNGEQVIREKVEEIFLLVTNQGEELLSTKLNRQKCQWLLEGFFTNHAIRRYKQRIGRRTASKRRIFTQIIKDLERDVQDRLNLPTSKHYILVTSKYKAVCYKNRVITIYLLDEAHEDFYEEELSAV